MHDHSGELIDASAERARTGTYVLTVGCFCGVVMSMSCDIHVYI